MSDLKIQGEVSLDSSNAEQALGRVEQSAARMAKKVEQSGVDAGKPLESLGEKGNTSAQKLDSATKSMIQSIQRTTAVMEAGSKSSSKYFETLAAQRGIDVDALKPYLAQLDAVSAKQAQATQAMVATAPAMKNLGVSAAQTAAAMRNVPAQFTDIVVSLQSGQKPMTVLLQQGGQLKDMFGGIGPAARALGTYVGGLINPFTLAAAAAGGLAFAYSQGSKEADAYAKAIIMTGNAAGVTTNQLATMAASVSRTVGTQGAAAAEALAELAGTGQVAGQNLEYFSRVAVQMERTVGQSAAKTAEDLADLGKKPLEASEKLNEKYRFLTAAVYEQIKALQDQGREEEAAEKAQTAYIQAFDKRTKEIEANLGTIERGWKLVKDAAKEGWDAMLNVGRKDTLEDQLKSVRSQIDAFNPFSLFGPSMDQLKARESQLTQLALAEFEVGAAIAAANDKEQARIKWLSDSNSYLSKNKKEQAELTKAIKEATAAGVTQGELETRLAAIREKYKEKGGSGNTELANLRAKITAEKQYLEALRARGTEADKLTEGEKLVLQLTEQLNGKLEAKVRTEKLAQLEKAKELASVQKEIEFKKELIENVKKFSDARAKDTASATSEVQKINERAQALEDEVRAFGLGKDAVEAITIARLEEQRAALGQSEGMEERIALIDKEIAARKRLQTALSAKEAKEEAKKAAEETAREWKRAAEEQEREFKRMSESINESLTDALLRGFESGKDFASNFRDTIVNMFKTLVLRPVISAVINPVAGALTGALNSFLGSATGGAGSGLLGSVMSSSSLLSAGKTLWSGFSNGFSGFMSNITGGLQNIGSLFGMGGKGIVSGAASQFISASTSIADLAEIGALTGGSTGTAGLATLADLAEVGMLTGGSTGATGGIAASGAAGSAGFAGIPVVGWIAAGMMANANLYKQGWNAQNGSIPGGMLNPLAGSTVFTDKALRGLGLSGSTAAILSGSALMSKIFGRSDPEVAGTGIEGSITNAGFTGNNFTHMLEKGGWFSSDKRYTLTSALDKDAQTALNTSALAMIKSLNDMTNAIGLGTDQIQSYGEKFKVDLTGVKSEEIGGKIAQAFSTMSDTLTARLIDDFRTSRTNVIKGEAQFITDEASGAPVYVPGTDTTEAVAQTPLTTSIDAYIGDIVRLSDAFRANTAGVKDMEGAYATHVKALVGLAVTMKDGTAITKVFGASLDFTTLEKFAKSGESVIDAFGRLTTLFSATNAIAVTLGKDAATAFGAVGVASADARQRLIDLAGGVDALANGAAYFAQNFLTEAERMAPVIKSVAEQMAAMGHASVDTKEEFKNLVKGLDLSTESGAKTYTALMQIAPAFAQVAEYTGKLAEEAKNAAPAVDHVAEMMVRLATGLGKFRAVADSAFADVEKSVAAEKAKAQKDYDDAIKAIDNRETAIRKKYDDDVAKVNDDRIKLKGDYDEAVLRLNDKRDAAVETYRLAIEDLNNEKETAAKAFKDATKSMTEERNAAVKAYAEATKIIGAQISAVQATISKLTQLTGSLSSTLSGLRMQGQEGFYRQQAQAQIRDALTTARATGNLPEAAKLADALRTVSQPSTELFGSFQDYQRDFFRTAIDIRDLNDIATDQLGKAETELSVLESTRDLMAANHDALLAKLDEQREALERAYELQGEAFAQQADAMRKAQEELLKGFDASRKLLDDQFKKADALLEKQLTALADKLKIDLQVLDDERTAAKDKFDTRILELDDLLDIARKQYEETVGIHSAVKPLDQAIKDLKTALADYSKAKEIATTIPNSTAAKLANQMLTDIDKAGGLEKLTADQQALINTYKPSQAEIDRANAVYMELLGRQAGDHYAAAFAAAIKAGTSEADLIAAIKGSAEYQARQISASTQTEVTNLVKTALGIAFNDPASNAKAGATTAADLALQYITSVVNAGGSAKLQKDQEALIAKYAPTTAEIAAIKDLFKQLLGHEGEGALAGAYAAKIKGGLTTESAVVAEIRASAEFAARALGEAAQEEFRRMVGSATGRFPGFASGGYHAGGLRIVGEAGPELEWTGPSQIINASDTSRILNGSNEELIAEIQALRAEIRTGQAVIASNTGKAAKTLDKWDYDGMPETTTA